MTAGKENHPMTEVSWYGSAAYCNWRSAMEGRQPGYDLTTWTCDFTRNGYRLPTEAEWEKAARGGQYDPYWRFPWGDSLDGSKANYWLSGDPYEGNPNENQTTPVGYYNDGQIPLGVDMANGYGLYDMSGNVWEWCNDWYSGTYYTPNPVDNPRGPATGSNRVLRGGSWGNSDINLLRCANRDDHSPAPRNNNNGGFRLALNTGGSRGADCNANGVPDECDLAQGASPDCNTNNMIDECEIGGRLVWTQATANPGWSGRYNHAAVVFDGRIWVTGGLGAIDFQNDVWSTTDGLTWTQATANAAWARRERHSVAAFNNRMWLCGGWPDYFSDVYSSTDGVNWNVHPSAPWAGRIDHSSVAYHDRLWIVGGRAGSTRMNDVWYTTDGSNWTQQTLSAQFAGRYGQASVAFGNHLWILGGSTGNDWQDVANDVWSSDDGTNWGQVTGAAAWRERHAHVAVSYAGRIWIMAGENREENKLNDVWYSTDGANWTVEESPPWATREAPAAVVFNGAVWIMGGWTGGQYVSDVWYAGDRNDCNNNLIPDECESDCNANAVPDECDISQGNSRDADSNGVPDDCPGAAVIIEHPISQPVCEYDSVEFTVTAAGEEPLFYQWRKDGMNLPGQTQPTLIIDWVGPDEEAEYTVLVSNRFRTTESQVATLTMMTIPTITLEPLDRALCVGGNATLTVLASGSALAYQWRMDGMDIPGATDLDLVFEPVELQDDGVYDVIVSNDCGAAFSNFVTVLVRSGPTITESPADELACIGESISFNVISEGESPTIQWRKETFNLPGQTTDTLVIDAVVPEDSGVYDVVVTDACGATTSPTFTFTVVEAPFITTQPMGWIACGGNYVSMAVEAMGTMPISYQWRKDGVDLPNQSLLSLVISPVGELDVGEYDVVVSNPCGTVISEIAVLEVNAGPTIVEQPRIVDPADAESVCAGVRAVLGVGAEGEPPLGYQWRKDEVELAGQTGETLVIDLVTAEDAAAYDVVVSNGCGTTFSEALRLKIDVGPSIVEEPADQSVCDGSAVEFRVVADGSPTLDYQWYKDGAEIFGATADSYAIPSAGAVDVGSYSCEIVNDCGTTLSRAASLTFASTPAILAQPQGFRFNPPDSISLTIQVNGDASYRWRKDGVELTDGDRILGVTTAGLTINPSEQGDAGVYDVVVSNPCGTILSEPAEMLACVAPTIAEQPSSQTICSGGTLVLAATADGTPPLTYQWRKDGVGIPGATSDRYEIDPATDLDSGNYDIVVTNACGQVVSDAAPVIVWLAGTGDPNGDGVVNGSDVDGFIRVFLDRDRQPGLASCATDLDSDGDWDETDVSLFVDLLLGP